MESAINYVNQLIAEAHQKNASDIHFEPQKENLLIRFRIDGFLRNKEHLPKSFEQKIISRIKIMAGLDIAEKRIGQDGRINFPLEGINLDLRISTLPTIFGEKLVARILSQEKQSLNIKEIGLAKNLALLQELISRPDGLILITGPTGSGKTTTLYAILKEISSPEKNVITLEDPVEYVLPGINQIQVNPKAGLTFAAGLRWVLRQDPDIIMVGEIRDLETARLAISAALTGHLVLTTLHTTRSSETIARLNEMGLELYLLAAALKGIINQRLIRKICPACPNCDFTGYLGRTGVFEIVKITEKIKAAILKEKNSFALGKIIEEEGFFPLYQTGLEKVNQGVTTLEELGRVVNLN